MKASTLLTDELFQLERRIAQRADELSRRLGVDPTQALEHWRQAEREVFGIADEPGEYLPLRNRTPAQVLKGPTIGSNISFDGGFTK